MYKVESDSNLKSFWLSNYFWHHTDSIHCLHSIWVGFSGGSLIKYPPANEGDMGSVPGRKRSSGEGSGNLLQYSPLVWTEEPGRLQGTASQRVRQDYNNNNLKNSTRPSATCSMILPVLMNFQALKDAICSNICRLTFSSFEVIHKVFLQFFYHLLLPL